MRKIHCAVGDFLTYRARVTSRRRFLLAGSVGAAGAAGAAALGPAGHALAAAPVASKVFHDAYAGKCGRLARSDSGHRYAYTGALDLVARDGALQLSEDSLTRPLPGAAYQQTDLGGPIAFVGAWFRLDDAGGRTTNGSGILLGGFAGKLVDATTVTAGLHLAFGLDWWAYYVFQNGVPSVLAGGSYDPLATGTLLYAEVTIVGSTATVLTPDGAGHAVTDPRLGTLGRSWLVTEVTRNADTDVLGAYTALQAATK